MTTAFDPQIGDRCNYTVWTDTDPCTVIARTPRTVKVRIDKAEILKAPKMVPGGFAAVVVEQAEWQIREDPGGRVQVFSLRKHGRWKLQGTPANSQGNDLNPGWRKYHDYGF